VGDRREAVRDQCQSAQPGGRGLAGRAHSERGCRVQKKLRLRSRWGPPRLRPPRGVAHPHEGGSVRLRLFLPALGLSTDEWTRVKPKGGCHEGNEVRRFPIPNRLVKILVRSTKRQSPKNIISMCFSRNCARKWNCCQLPRTG
jgi:hypothetical protein